MGFNSEDCPPPGFRREAWRWAVRRSNSTSLSLAECCPFQQLLWFLVSSLEVLVFPQTLIRFCNVRFGRGNCRVKRRPECGAYSSSR